MSDAEWNRPRRPDGARGGPHRSSILQAGGEIISQRSRFLQPSCRAADLSVEAFELIRRHVIAMAVEPDGVVKSLNVLEDQRISTIKRINTEPVQPFPLDQRVKGFNTGIIVRIAPAAEA